MRINSKCTISPIAWSDSTLKEFLEAFKGKATEKELREIHKECKKYKKKAPKL